MIKQLAQKILKHTTYKKSTNIYLNMYKRIISKNPDLTKHSEKEKEWLAYWRKYDKKLSPLYCRVFSNYIDEDIKQMIPLEFISSMVEPILTPRKCSFFYGDKNNFNFLLPREYMPKVYLRNMDGFFYDENYNHLSEDSAIATLNTLSSTCSRVILKPSRSDSGVGVQIFSLQGGFLKNKKGEILSLELLQSQYKYNYLLQECIEQSNYLSQFNPSSVNTIRIAVYRDNNGEEHTLSSVLRIGASGSEVDNAHMGGMFCGISETGKVGNWVVNQFGERKNVYNGLDFESSDWVIPNFDKVKEFALQVSKHLLSADLIALDIALDKDNKPQLVEFNVCGFSAWLFLMGGNSVFGEFTEEVMERCYKAYQKLEYHAWSPISRNKCLRR